MRIIKPNGTSVYFDLPEAEEGVVYTYPAGATINGQRVLMLKDGEVFHFDPSDEDNYNLVIGMSDAAYTTGDPVEVVTEGEIGSLVLVTGDKYWATANGLLTNVVPTSGIVQLIGIAKNTNTLVLNISEPIILA